MAERFDNGIFLDRVLTKERDNLIDIKKGQGTTLMISENVDAGYYSDGPGSDTGFITLNTSGAPNTWPVTWAGQLAAAHNCSERGAGFVWWDTSKASTTTTPPPVPTGNATQTTNLRRPKRKLLLSMAEEGDFEPTRVGWPSTPTDLTDPATPATINSDYTAPVHQVLTPAELWPYLLVEIQSSSQRILSTVSIAN